MSEAARSLSGKTAVVLGASGPYGAAAARMLAREGVKLVLGGRSRDKLEALEEEIQATGGEVVVVGTHLAKRHHPMHLVEAAAEAFGELDILLYMAHASAPPLRSLDLDAWERSLEVNVRGFLYTLAAALPIMRERGGGHVVVLSAENPEAPDPLYSASRAATRVLLRETSREFSGQGIRTSEIRLDDSSWASPERCAESIRRLLVDPPDASAGLTTRGVSEG